MSIEDVLADLRQDYLEALPQRINEIKVNLHQGDYIQLQDDFHKLKGTGKTYGIPEISELCAVLECICVKSQDKIPQALPSGLNLLNEICEQRTKGQVFALEANPQFSELSQLV